MAQKIVNITDIGPVVLQKRTNTNSIRLHIRGSRVKATMPSRLPYSMAEKFVVSKKDWIIKNLQPIQLLSDGCYIGKNHRISVKHKEMLRPTTRVNQKQINVSLPIGLEISNSEAQKVITNAAERALKQETEQLVAPRLQDLAFEHGYNVKAVSSKRLRSRWGSCDTHANIVINSYIVQLPWELIDYVLIHELAHINHLNHGPGFWSEVESILPDYKLRRQQLKQHSPHVITT